MNSKLLFDIYGYLIRIESSDFDLSKLKIYLDFNYFESQNQAPAHLSMQINKTDIFKTLGFALFKTSMCDVRQISYNKRQFVYAPERQTLATLHEHSFSQTKLTQLDAANINVVDDILFFYINSCAGEYLDAHGLMRVHALSANIKNQALMVYGKPETGKSTMALKIIQVSDAALYSDEVTLIDLKTKNLLPFPIRIGSADVAPEVSEESKFTYFFKTKKLFSIAKNKIAKPTKLKKIFIISKEPTLRIEFFLEILFGIGLIQMFEFLVRLNNLNVLFRILINRIRLIFFLKNFNFTNLKFQDPLEKKLTLVLNN